MIHHARVDDRTESIEIAPKKVVAVLTGLATITAFVTGAVIWLGGAVVGPGAALAAESKARERMDSVLLIRAETNRNLIEQHDSTNRARWDSLLTLVRPLRITTCARATAYERYLMQMNCEMVLERARSRAEGRP
jgi:hypothetical protein